MAGYTTTSTRHTPDIDKQVENLYKFKKDDSKKLRWNLIPVEALEEILKVFEFGATKYGEFNWLANSNSAEWSRLINALERHFVKFKKSQDLDEESGLYELAHLLTNGIMLLQFQILELGKDNRDYRIGQKFNKLTTVKFIEVRNKTNRIYSFKCDCGKVVKASYNNVLKGNTKSCGCLHSDLITPSGFKKHNKKVGING